MILRISKWLLLGLVPFFLYLAGCGGTGQPSTPYGGGSPNTNPYSGSGTTVSPFTTDQTNTTPYDYSAGPISLSPDGLCSWIVDCGRRTGRALCGNNLCDNHAECVTAFSTAQMCYPNAVTDIAACLNGCTVDVACAQVWAANVTCMCAGLCG